MTEDEKGFVIVDRRHNFDEEEKGEAKALPAEEKPAEEAPAGEKQEAGRPSDEKLAEAAEKAQQRQEARDGSEALPAVNFATFVVSLSSSVLFHLGEIADPHTGQVEEDLPLAKQTIDILAMLQEKTQGNLSRDEEELMKNVLYDLRLRYVKKSR